MRCSACFSSRACGTETTRRSLVAERGLWRLSRRDGDSTQPLQPSVSMGWSISLRSEQQDDFPVIQVQKDKVSANLLTWLVSTNSSVTFHPRIIGELWFAFIPSLPAGQRSAACPTAFEQLVWGNGSASYSGSPAWVPSRPERDAASARLLSQPVLSLRNLYWLSVDTYFMGLYCLQTVCEIHS